MQSDTDQRQCGTHFNSMSDGRWAIRVKASLCGPLLIHFNHSASWCDVCQPECRHNWWPEAGWLLRMFLCPCPTAAASLYLWPYKKHHNYVLPFMRIEKLCTGRSKNVNNFTLLPRDTPTQTHACTAFYEALAKNGPKATAAWIKRKKKNCAETSNKYTTCKYLVLYA